jgi:hypothetical protein
VTFPDQSGRERPYFQDMSSETHTSRESAGGDGLLFLIATAIVCVVTAEALLIAFSSWWLLALVLLFAVCAAVGVATALVRLMDDDAPLPVAEATVVATRPAPVARPRTIAH